MKNKLAIKQMDTKYKQMKKAVPLSLGLHGKWISTIRGLLGMSMRQLGERLSLTPPSINQFERSEENGSISIKNLEKIAEKMGMIFYYGFYPKDGRVQNIIEIQARKVAKEIVERTSHTMNLENQKNSQARLKKAIEERTSEIVRKMPRSLWD